MKTPNMNVDSKWLRIKSKTLRLAAKGMHRNCYINDLVHWYQWNDCFQRFLLFPAGIGHVRPTETSLHINKFQACAKRNLPELCRILFWVCQNTWDWWRGCTWSVHRLKQPQPIERSWWAPRWVCWKRLWRPTSLQFTYFNDTTIKPAWLLYIKIIKSGPTKLHPAGKTMRLVPLNQPNFPSKATPITAGVRSLKGKQVHLNKWHQVITHKLDSSWLFDSVLQLMNMIASKKLKTFPFTFYYHNSIYHHFYQSSKSTWWQPSQLSCLRPICTDSSHLPIYHTVNKVQSLRYLKYSAALSHISSHESAVITASLLHPMAGIQTWRWMESDVPLQLGDFWLPC